MDRYGRIFFFTQAYFLVVNLTLGVLRLSGVLSHNTALWNLTGLIVGTSILVHWAGWGIFAIGTTLTNALEEVNQCPE